MIGRALRPLYPSLRIATAVLIVAVVAVFGRIPAAYADTCSPTPENGGGTNTYGGGYYTTNQAPYPEYASTYITPFNPTYVYTSSSAWVALENRQYYSCTLGAQAGWVRDVQGATRNELVFYEYRNKDCSYSRTYYQGTNAPPYQNYGVLRGISCLGCSDGFVAIAGNSQWDMPITWGSDSVEYTGETGDYGGSSGGRPTGSHFPGDSGNGAQFNGMNFEDQYSHVNNDPTLLYQCGTSNNVTCIPGVSGWYMGVNNASSPGYGAMVIWDQRCS